jgi:hypothetical protein
VVPTLTMIPAAVLGGTVTSAASGEGLGGVEIALYANLIPTAAPIAVVTTDANGSWQVGNLPAGTYRYRMTAPGYVLEWHTDAATKADSTGIVLAAGDQQTDLADELAASP